MKNSKYILLYLLFFLLLSVFLYASEDVTRPKEFFGYSIGDDYFLADYTQMIAYWEKLARESERLKLFPIGESAEGRTIWMAVVTSPENHEELNRYREISRKLALAEGLSDDEARKLASEGKAVVWIDGGLHGTEVLGAQQLVELVYQMVSRNDPETLRILNDVILLAACPNPDGMELVSNWYMRHEEPKKRTTRGLPVLYQKYIGHDNNRDFYMVTQPETEAVCNVFYHTWFPQIVYNHHQTGPAGTVLFAPPFRDPFNYAFDPLIPVGIEMVGAAMHNRFVAENKPGATMRSGAGYSTWWNGGLRTTVYYHNMIGILTETIGNPTPMEIPFLPQRLLPSFDLPFPILPQKWHFRQSVEYAITADKAILDVASRYREEFLYNIYQMGRNSIQKGSRDTWTIIPNVIKEIEETIKKDKAEMSGTGWQRGYPLEYIEITRDPEKRDPRGYIIPSNQPDFLTAVKFVNALIKTGIKVLKAESDFQIGEKSYPADSLIVKSAQAFRPHILSMFEPQNYPDDRLYPGGPPNPPYDSAGWTLAYQMGVEFDRILDGFEGPFTEINGLVKPPAGKIIKEENVSGYLLDHRINDSFIAVNRLLKTGAEVYWLKNGITSRNTSFPAGTIYIPAGKNIKPIMEKAAAELGLVFTGIDSKPEGEVFKLKKVRLGLWDRYGGSMDSGWIRWILEKFEFPYELVFAKKLEAGNLRQYYDVLIFVDRAIPERERGEDEYSRYFQQPKPEEIPPEYRERLGEITIEKTVPNLAEFLKEGGTILALGSSTCLAYHLGLPVKNGLTEILDDGKERPLPRDKFFIPGSILEVCVNNSNPLAYGLSERVDVYFNRSPVFHLLPEASIKDIQPVAWYDKDKPLRSGWAWGQHYLKNGSAVVDCKVGQGKLFLYGPEITFRAQPHGAFKFLFNGIYYGQASEERL